MVPDPSHHHQSQSQGQNMGAENVSWEQLFAAGDAGAGMGGFLHGPMGGGDVTGMMGDECLAAMMGLGNEAWFLSN